MFNAAPTNSGKRKMDELAGGSSQRSSLPLSSTVSNQFNGRPFSSATNSPLLPIGLHLAPTGNVDFSRRLNTTLPTIRPFSFTSLLMAEELEDPLVTEMRTPTEQIEEIVTHHTDILHKEVGGILERHQKSIPPNEETLKKLKEKETEIQFRSGQNEELERQVEGYKEEGERLSRQMMELEEQISSMKLCLQRCATKKEAIVLNCKFCHTRRRATVMMWPCRHVSVCTQCNEIINACPVCKKVKDWSVEVILL